MAGQKQMQFPFRGHEQSLPAKREWTSAGGDFAQPRMIGTPLGKIRVTEVYESYWRFATERQDVFFRRLRGSNRVSLSDNPILQTYRFTNVYRASDRVSQFLIKNVIYNPDYSTEPEEVLFRILLFKLFNKIETWQSLEREQGELTFRYFNQDRYAAILDQLRGNGETIYSAAYIMPSGRSAFGSASKHRNHLALIDFMMRDRAALKLADARSLQTVFEIFKSYPTFGQFLAYQLAIDLNYSEVIDFSENDFVVAGPGALDGLAKCFGALDHSPADLIRLMCDRQQEEFEFYGLDFQDLWGRPLHLIDCQNLFCEISKYARVAYPDVQGVSNRTRIKQKFSQKGPIEPPWYPPKWGLNEHITTSSARND